MKKSEPVLLPEMLKKLIERFEPMQMEEQSSPQYQENLGKLMDMLIVLYVTTNMGVQKIPLKLFMNDLEKRMIESCLSLTLGNQRSAASILGVKPTALFEKIKKHGIHEAHRKASLRAGAPLTGFAGFSGARPDLGTALQSANQA